jgi:hypothetical protein
MGFFGVDQGVDLYHFAFSILLDDRSLGTKDKTDFYRNNVILSYKMDI